MLFLILPCFMLSITDANRLSTFCDNGSSNYTLNRAFESNLKQLLQSLPSRTSETGFYSQSIGHAPNSVYGQALCRGDVTPTVCQNCLENASQEIQNMCKSKVGIIWYESCSIYYSYRNFFTMMEYIGKYPGSDYQRKNVSSPGLFKKALLSLMNNLSIEASLTKRMFAAAEVKFSKSRPIYGLVQCTRDITNSDCKGCLGSALKDLYGCCDEREGGFVVSRNCNVRFELYPFYNYETSTGGKGKIPMVVVVTCIPVFVIAVLIGSSYVVCRRWKKGARKDEERSEHAFLQELARPAVVTLTQKGDFISSDELPFMHLDIIKAATDDFSDANKLGQGGFGAVYKGVLPDGKEVAAKRLARRSRQGLEEFKNEIILIAKLQHRNLVRLLGCSIGGEEKLLIYEFTPNKSLDIFIFDSKRRSELNWKICYNIINGVARGLLYFHEDSRLKIIHRDLKPSNILLDEEMVAKISDFSMARIFCEDQSTANTKRLVGTYGYMAPEYAMEGLFSVKSDVFSFGVIIFEIMSGKRNSGFYLTGHAQTLLAYAWQLWTEGKELELVDPVLMESCSTLEVRRCIQIGLLCVQEDPAVRPSMSSVMAFLRSESLAPPEPRKPAFSVGRIVPVTKQSSRTDPSLCDITLSTISPR